MESYKYYLQSKYMDKSIYAHHKVFLHYKGGVYVSIGSINGHVLEKPLVERRYGTDYEIDFTSYDILMRLDTVLGYGKPEPNQHEFGDLVIAYTTDLYNSDIALGKHKEKKRGLCECGCQGEKNEDEAYAQEWYYIKNDDELVDTSLYLDSIN